MKKGKDLKDIVRILDYPALESMIESGVLDYKDLINLRAAHPELKKMLDLKTKPLAKRLRDDQAKDRVRALIAYLFCEDVWEQEHRPHSKLILKKFSKLKYNKPIDVIDLLVEWGSHPDVGYDELVEALENLKPAQYKTWPIFLKNLLKVANTHQLGENNRFTIESLDFIIGVGPGVDICGPSDDDEEMEWYDNVYSAVPATSSYLDLLEDGALDYELERDYLTATRNELAEWTGGDHVSTEQLLKGYDAQLKRLEKAYKRYSE